MKMTFSQANKFINSQARCKTIAEWCALSQKQRDKATKSMLEKTGWNLTDYICEEIKQYTLR